VRHAREGVRGREEKDPRQGVIQSVHRCRGLYQVYTKGTIFFLYYSRVPYLLEKHLNFSPTVLVEASINQPSCR
jgi:hypothetical protein